MTFSIGPFAFAWLELDSRRRWRQRFGIWHESAGDAGFAIGIWA